MPDPALISIASLAGRETVKATARVVAERLLNAGRKDPSNSDVVDRIVSDIDDRALGDQVRQAYLWATEIHVQGMPEPVLTASTAVALDFAPVPRRFRRDDSATGHFDEGELASSLESYAILGDPGAGKTTTLKRLTLRLFEEAGVGEASAELRMPVVIVCREIDWSHGDLLTVALALVGISSDALPPVLAESRDKKRQLAATLLDELDALLVIDGLDEIPEPARRARAAVEVESVNRLCDRAKIVCSARSGEAPHLEGLRVAELVPLSDHQIREIASRRVRDPSAFLQQVELAGLVELLDRPLFLNQLITVYEATGSLPDRPVDLCGQLVRLLLHEWDEQRRVERASAYGTFDPLVKQDFLSELAFRLTIRGRATFTEAELMEIFREIAPAFELPDNQARKVVREIESHVGIVEELSNGFQFSHLTIQEYLCAYSIVRQGMTDEVARYLVTYPAVVAVAVAQSSRPGQWLADCTRRSRRFETTGLADTFVRRLSLERPRFTKSSELGEALLDLMTQSSGRDLDSWQRLFSSEPVSQSIRLASAEYHFDPRPKGVRMTRRIKDDDVKRRRNVAGTIPIGLYDEFHWP